ncbi:MAG: hypothetical protein ACRD1N_11115 [Terriglobia bacterium]
MANESANPMEFFVQQQAQFWADMQALKENIARNTEHIARHDQQIATLAGLVGQVAQAELRLVDRIEDNARSIRELREAQANSDYKLNALIETVDKLVRRNGGSSHK